MNSHQRRKERRAHERFRRAIEADPVLGLAVQDCIVWHESEAEHQAEMRRLRESLGLSDAEEGRFDAYHSTRTEGRW